MIHLNEIGIPFAIAMKVTYPEKVNVSNRTFLEKCIENGPHVYPGAVAYIKRNSKNTSNQVDMFHYKMEMPVIRHLCDGDFVLMNRQPTLKKDYEDILSVMEGHSFRLNVNVKRTVQR